MRLATSRLGTRLRPGPLFGRNRAPIVTCPRPHSLGLPAGRRLPPDHAPRHRRGMARGAGGLTAEPVAKGACDRPDASIRLRRHLRAVLGVLGAEPAGRGARPGAGRSEPALSPHDGDRDAPGLAPRLARTPRGERLGARRPRPGGQPRPARGARPPEAPRRTPPRARLVGARRSGGPSREQLPRAGRRETDGVDVDRGAPRGRGLQPHFRRALPHHAARRLRARGTSRRGGQGAARLDRHARRLQDRLPRPRPGRHALRLRVPGARRRGTRLATTA
jgi:hypothetical protein